MRYGLEEITIIKIQQLLSGIPEIEKAILYGSRAKGNFKPGSDIDITLVGSQLSLPIVNQINLLLDDLMLPYNFDISIFHQIKNEDLLDHIKRVGIDLYKK